jgi:hypothetical protein
MVTVLNTDSTSQTVTIQLLDTATTYKIITVTLLVGDKLTYTHGSAWQVVNNSGNIKYSVLSSSGVDSFSGGSTGLTPATATTGAVTLGGTLAVASGGTGTATPALVAGTNVTITGTWPNQTVNATSSGTVTSVAALTLGTTGTDVSSTVANSTTTPVITLNLPTASATNRGALSAADWTTFNSKGSGTVTSVTGTSPISSSGGATPAISLNASYGDTQNPYASKTANYVLAAPNGTAGVPTFRAIVAADVPTLNQNTTGNAATATTATNIAAGSNLQIPYNTGSGATSFIVAPTLASTFLQYNGTGFAWAASAGIGTVTSVAATVPSFLSITGSPITTAGTLAISYSGTALPIANGGTGQTTASAAFNALSPITSTGDLIIGNGANSATRLGIGANTYVLTSNGTTASWSAAAGGVQNYDYQVSTTGFSYTFAAGVQTLIMNPAGTLATGTITMPAAPADGMVVTFSTTQQITALTVNANTGQTINNALTKILAGQSMSYVYRSASTAWFVFNTALSASMIGSLLGYIPVDYLVVAGGGGGATTAGSGGGAGGMLTGSLPTSVSAGVSYTITVGAGGAGGTSDGTNGQQGSNSVFGSFVTSLGGGLGKHAADGASGGSGSGGGYATGGQKAAGAGTNGQGNAGGTGGTTTSPDFPCGGGGGAGAVGGNGGSSVGGNGGAGLASSITGSSVTYAGGGGGSGSGGTTGGTGGGGNGGTISSGRQNGTANTGGGGGGGGAANNGQGAGGSGIVILRYPDSYAVATTTGSPTVTVTGGYRIYQFTASGTITF